MFSPQHGEANFKVEKILNFKLFVEKKIKILQNIELQVELIAKQRL